VRILREAEGKDKQGVNMLRTLTYKTPHNTSTKPDLSHVSNDTTGHTLCKQWCDRA
jgi:hypothetical protein